MGDDGTAQRQRCSVGFAAREILRWVGSRSPMQAVLCGLVLAVFIEAATCVMRFGLGMQSGRDSAWLAPFTMGYRIHHSYYGLVMLAAAAFVRGRGVRNVLLLVGASCVLSDLIHHFIVLQFITGSAEFYMRYPVAG